MDYCFSKLSTGRLASAARRLAGWCWRQAGRSWGTRAGFLVVLSVALSGCEFEPKTQDDKLRQVTAAAVIPVQGMPGYSVRSIVVDRGNMATHYVYLLLKDGEPVSGTSSGAIDGKQPVNTTLVADFPKGAVTCVSLSDCEAQVTALREAELLKPLRDCRTLAECTMVLESIWMSQEHKGAKP